MQRIVLRNYYGYGLNISSEIKLPLFVSDQKDDFDVIIKLGKIPKNVECEFFFHHTQYHRIHLSSILKTSKFL